MNNLTKRITAFTAAALMLSGACLNAAAENKDELAVREYVVSEFVQSVGRNNLNGSDYILSTFADADDIDEKYKDDLSKAVTNGLVRGYDDKTIKPKENITRVEALSILSRCLKDLDVTGDAIQFDDVPDWAESDINRLSSAGIVKGYGDGKLGAADNITVEQVKLLTDRVDKMVNPLTPGESFYGYINNKTFRNAELSSTMTFDANHGAIIEDANSWSYFGDIVENVSNTEEEMLKKLMNGELTYEKGSPEQRVHDMLLCIAGSYEDNEENTEVFEGYRSKIINAESIDELIDTGVDIYNNTGLNTLFNVTAELDPDTNKPYPKFEIGNAGIGALIAYSSDAEKKYGEIYKTLIKDYIKTIMPDVTDADAQNAYELQKKLGAGKNYFIDYIKGRLEKLNSGEGYTEEAFDNDLDKLSEEHPEIDPNTLAPVEGNALLMVTREEADKQIKNVKVSEILSSLGFKNSEKVMFESENYVKTVNEVLNNNNLKYLKINALINLGMTLKGGFTEEEADSLVKMMVFSEIITRDGDPSIVETAHIADMESLKEERRDVLCNENITELKSLMPMDIGLMYCNYCYDDETSEKIGELVLKMLDAYINRFKNNTWMNEETKQNAIKKIENMLIVIGYPDNYEYADITPVEEGGTYFSNLLKICKNNSDTVRRNCEEDEFLRTQMLFPPDTVNACYIPQYNTINIYAGILQKPIYDKEASDAANLGAIGMIVAHEIGHAFDADGASYDENGSLKNWWTDEDYAKFKQIQSEFVEYYRNFEIIEGVTQDSEKTIAENMADFAGITCVLDIIGDDKAAQKEALESFANMWAMLGTEKYLTLKSVQDSHSTNQVRVNACVASLDCFYDIYGIKEGDKMYVAPEKRLKLW